MRILQKALCGFMILLALSGLSVCAKNPYIKAAVPKNAAPVISDGQFSTLQKSGWLNLTDDCPASWWWAANDQKSTMQKVVLWLKAAKPYTGKIPKSANTVFHANVGPSVLFLRNSSKHFITAEPEWYVVQRDSSGKPVHYLHDVVRLDVYGKTAFVVSKPLYDWLKSDLWKPEFHKGIR